MCQHQNQCNALLGNLDSFQEGRHLGIHETSKYYCKTSMPPTMGKRHSVTPLQDNVADNITKSASESLHHQQHSKEFKALTHFN